MPTITWETESDWDESKEDSGFAHESVADTENDDASIVKRGYSYERHPLNNTGLVGWWPLHDDTATDYSGNDNHGTLNGPTTGVAGRGGLQGMSFNASENDIIDVGGTNWHISGNDPVTLSVWLHWDGTQTSDQKGIYTHSSQGSNNPPIGMHFADDGSITFHICESSGSCTFLTSSTGVVPENDWAHFAGIHDPENDELRLYKNGSQIESTGHSGGIWDVSEDIHFGNWKPDYNDWLDGTICDIRLYNYALSESEIQTLYEWGSLDLARPRTDGTSRYALDGDATDSWGSNDGTNNGVTFVSDAIRGQAGSFSGGSDAGDYISTPLAADFGAGAFTVSGWIEWDSTNSYDALAGTYDDSTGWILRKDDGESLEAWCDGTILHGSTAPKSAYVHYTFVRRSDGAGEIYLNGALDASGDASGDVSSSNGMNIGNNGNGNNAHDGLIDDVRIYPFALEPWEVHDLYQWGTFGRDQRKFLVTA